MKSVSAEFPKLACECSSCGLSIMDVSNFEMHTQFSLHDSLPKSAHTTSSPHFSSERSSLYCNIADVNVSKWHKRWRIVGLIGTLRLRFLENRESQQVESNKNISTSCSVLPLCPSVLSLPYICLVQTRFFLVFNYWQNRVSNLWRCHVSRVLVTHKLQIYLLVLKGFLHIYSWIAKYAVCFEQLNVSNVTWVRMIASCKWQLSFCSVFWVTLKIPPMYNNTVRSRDKRYERKYQRQIPTTRLKLSNWQLSATIKLHTINYKL